MNMAARVDLNADLGESFGRWRLGADEAVMEFVTSANIACGVHAGDPGTMHRTMKLAAERGVAAGAHPGLPDLAGFGRRRMDVEPEEVFDLVAYQVGALQAFARLCGASLQHVKPHGALYNMAAWDPALAGAVADAVRASGEGLILFGLAGSLLVKAGRDRGLAVAEEVFADRAYGPDGRLLPRRDPRAMIRDPQQALERVLRMVREGRVRAADGADVAVRADTVCIHGDEPGSLALAQALRRGLEAAGVAVQKVSAPP
jgi:UPF0271 protein